MINISRSRSPFSLQLLFYLQSFDLISSPGLHATFKSTNSQQDMSTSAGSGAGSSGGGRRNNGAGNSADSAPKPDTKESKANPKISKALGTSAKRMQKELAEITLDPPPNCSAGPKGDNLYEWVSTILGPPGKKMALKDERKLLKRLISLQVPSTKVASSSWTSTSHPSTRSNPQR